MELSFAYRSLAAAFASEGIPHRKNEILAPHTTFRIGGPAALTATPESAESLARALSLCKEYGIPSLVLGAGSNLLLPDEGIEGCIIFTSGLGALRIDGLHLTADAGLRLGIAARAACTAGLSGLAFAYGIPGSIGGGVYMNAGAYGGELSDVVSSVLCCDMDGGECYTLSKEECGFSYRHSAFQDNGRIVLSATMLLKDGVPSAIREEMEDYMQRRRAKQPLQFPSAGSTFKRAPGHYTAQMIDEAGLKGYAIGGAQVSELHAGFIINRGGATADDVKRLIAHIQSVILKTHGVEIFPEIRILDTHARIIS